MDKSLQGALKVCKGDVPIHHKAFHLHKYGAVAGGHLIHTEHPTRHYEPEGRLKVKQRPGLKG